MKSKLIIISACVLLLAGCSEDFLERTPQGVFTLETYYTTTEEINTGLTYCYQAFWISEMQTGRFMVGNMMTQDATKGGASENEGVDIKNNIEYNILPNSSMAYRFWGPCYIVGSPEHLISCFNVLAVLVSGFDVVENHLCCLFGITSC